MNSSSDIENQLNEWLSGARQIVVAGIGNPIRCDDFLGVKIVQELQGKVSSNVHLIECETVPESFMDEIVELQPSHVLLIDAAVMGLDSGEIRLFDSNKVTNLPAISTHTLPIRIFCDYISQMAKSKIALLLVEPQNVEFGEKLSEKVDSSANWIVNILLKLLSR